VIGLYEAEAAFLGCLLHLRGPVGIAYLLQTEDADFVDPRNRAVLEAMRRLCARREPVDPVTVEGELRRGGLESSLYADKSAAVYLADLYGGVATVGSVGAYLTILLEHRARRQVEASGTRIAQAAERMDLDEVWSLVSDELSALGLQLARVTQRQQRGDLSR